MKLSLIFLLIMLTFLATPMISSGEGEPGGKKGEDTVHHWRTPVSKSPLTIPIFYRKEIQLGDDGHSHLTIPIFYRKEIQLSDDGHSHLTIPIFYRKEIQLSDEVMDLAMLFMLEKDLKAGHKMKLHFSQSSVVQSSFLPRQLADSIPFSSSKLDEILKRFGIKPGSEDAEAIKQTLMECEGEGIKGEEKHCATSFESMVDFATSKLGDKAEALSTVAARKEKYMQDYTIADSGVEKVSEEKTVVCHKEEYPYAVFYCHKLDKTSAYTVALEGADGTRVKAAAVCHHDTSQWHPKNLAFQVLKVKPGTVPTVCHFLPPQNHIVWVPKRIQIL